MVGIGATLISGPFDEVEEGAPSVMVPHLPHSKQRPVHFVYWASQLEHVYDVEILGIAKNRSQTSLEVQNARPLNGDCRSRKISWRQ